MNKINTTFRLLAATILIMLASLGKSQCTITIGYTNLGNGAYTFTAFASPTQTIGGIIWNFGDGGFAVNSPTMLTTSHTYTAPGSYTASVTYSTPCFVTYSTVITVSLSGSSCTLNAGFTATTSSGGSVLFTNTSSNTTTNTTYSWTFGDGGTSSSANPPAHTYTSNGNYIASLTAMNNSTCLSTYTMLVQVTTSTLCNLTAFFTYNYGSFGLVNFFSGCTNTLSNSTFSYSFGNGASSTFAYPATTYTANGTYTVTLVVSNPSQPGCTQTYSTAVTVTNAGVPCTAAFTHTTNANGQVYFTANTSSSNTIMTHSWNFGNNTSYSSAVNTATATYTATGLYTVSLVVLTPGGTCTAVDTVNIASISGCQLNANFSASQASGGVVTFNNLTTGTVSGVSYTWTFGNQGNSNQHSPVHTFTANGSFGVTLTVVNGTCVSTKTITINVSSNCNLSASFSHTLNNNGNVQFKSTSTGTNNGYVYQWNFGDNTSGSGSSVSHNYTANGVYTVTFTAKNSSVAPTCSGTAVQTITITSVSSCTLAASFTQSVLLNGVVAFFNTSTGTNTNTTYLWNFGDGFTGTGANPTHTYVNAGVHYVLLTVSNSTVCSDTTKHGVNVTGITCNANSNFTLVPTNVVKNWFAIPSYPWNVSNAVWSWGDGSFTNALYTSHQYSVSGNYNICLSVTVSCASTSSSCSTYSIFRSTADILNVNVIAPESILEGLNENAPALLGSVFPNPASTVLNVQASNIAAPAVTIRITNLLGETIYSVNPHVTDNSINEKLDIQNVPTGLYLLHLEAGNSVHTQKVLIDK
jgi:PKD repeat protein